MGCSEWGSALTPAHTQTHTERGREPLGEWQRIRETQDQGRNCDTLPSLLRDLNIPTSGWTIEKSFKALSSLMGENASVPLTPVALVIERF